MGGQLKLHILALGSILLLAACGQLRAGNSLPPTSSSPVEAARFEHASPHAGKSIDGDAGAKAAFTKDVLEVANGDEATQHATEVTANPVTALPAPCKAGSLSAEMSFICRLLPVIMKMDLQVFKQRQTVLRLQKQASLTNEQTAWLVSLRSQYGLSSTASFEEILQHVDVVPVALLISQAALESDWGRSNIARKSGNLFGRHGTPGKNSCYMVGRVCLVKYVDLDQMISDQIQYYNTANFKFMQSFRAARARLRASGKPLNSDTLSESLKGYAAVEARDPDKYPRQIRATLQGAYHIEQLAQNEEDVVEA